MSKSNSREALGQVIRSTGAAAVAQNVTSICNFKLKQVKCHLSAAGTSGTLTISIDSNAGSAYDTVLQSIDMTSVTDFVWSPESPIYCSANDVVKVIWANSGTKTYGVETTIEIVD